MYNVSDSTCSLDVTETLGVDFGCRESAPDMSTLGAYIDVNCTEIAETSGSPESDEGNEELALTADSGDHFKRGLSLYRAGFIMCCSWSIAATSAITLATTLV